MTYDAENRLLTYNGEELVYDADGNMTRGPVNGVMTDLVYDCRNRLVSAGGVTYTYDAENNRVKAETDSYTEEYFNDTVSASLSRVLEIKVTPKNGITDTAAGNTTAGSTTTVCIYGNGLIYERTGDIYRYHHYNYLGSTMKLTGSKGEITASFTYGTYGELLSGDNRLTKFLYNGRCGVTTDDNGLYYMRQRYYNPEIKRFVNQDILTGSLGNSQSLNRYSYVQGNPVSYTDPFGLSPLSGMFTGTTFAHCVFGLLGTVPGPVGITANIADAIVYALVDKDYYNAALSGFCAASFGFGSLAKITAGSAKCSKMFKVASSACGMIGNSLEFVDNAKNAMEVGFGMYNKYAIQGESFGWDTVLEAAEFTMAAVGTVGAFGGIRESSYELAEMLKASGVNARMALRGYLSDKLGVPESDSRGLFYSITNSKGGQVYVSKDQINQYDFKDIVDSAAENTKVNIISGIEGLPDGAIIPKKGLYTLDLDDFKGANVYNYTDLELEDMYKIITSPDITICAWCYSEKNQYVWAILAIDLGLE